MKFSRLFLSSVMLSGLLWGAVNINTASKDELMALPGIGDAKAEAIIKYRETNHFQNIDEIKNIKGIGDKRFELIKDDLAVSGDTDISDLKSVKNTKSKVKSDKSKKVKTEKEAKEKAKKSKKED